MKRLLIALMSAALLMPAAAAQTTKSKTATKKIVAPPTIPAGTAIHVRVNEDLTSANAQPGDAFTGVLAEAVVAGGQTLYVKGANVTGRVVAAKDSGRLSSPGILELELTTIQHGNTNAPVQVELFKIEGESHTKSNVTKIGGGAAAGAVIGAIAGGGKGAAIGAAIGAGAGTGVAAATGKKEATVESEAVLSFVAASPNPAQANTMTQPPANAANPTSPAPDRTAMKSYDDETTTAANTQSWSTFSARDRRLIRECFEDNAGSLPPGLAKREKLPPGLEKQLVKNGTLPPGLQKKVRSLPQVCENNLSAIPRDAERVVLNRRVMILDAAQKILDIFHLDE